MKRFLQTSAALAALSVAGVAMAQDEDKVSGVAGVTFTNEYISRGIIQEDQGVIAQPYAELSFALPGNIALFGGIWNSLHEASAPSAIPGTTDIWYEFDWYVGASTTIAEDFTVKLSYWEFLSPNDAFNVARNLELKIGYAGEIGGFALNPYFIVFKELAGNAGVDPVGDTDHGWYYEVGVGPSWTLNEGGDYPVSVGVPIFAGFGDGFYHSFNEDFTESDDEFFGYAAGGVTASVPLAFMGDDYGSWSLSGSVLYFFYGDGTEDVNEGPGEEGVDGDIVGALTLSVGF